ncbi:YwqG family protein [soil metagenome]
MNEIENIKKQIVRKATEFITGGFKPTNSISESWIGKVYLFKEDEEIPKDSEGNLMLPLFQLCLDNIENVPKVLSDTKVLTVFIANELPMDLAENGENWLIREYKKSENLTIKELTNPKSFIKPFPLTPQIIEEDYPVWDGGGLTSEMEDKILELENSGIIDDYYDITKNQYGHKLGGYPSFCQSGNNFGEDYEFVFQIASDEKANFNIIDSGTIFLAKNAKTGEWKCYCDFY